MAATQTIPQHTNAPTYFIFQSPANQFGPQTSEQNPIAPATATSSAAAGGGKAGSGGGHKRAEAFG